MEYNISLETSMGLEDGMIDQEIRIRAEVQQHDPMSCRFTVDRELFPGFARFADAERAQGSPLARRLFAIDGVAGVQINGNSVTVRKQNSDPWRSIGPLVGGAIRAHIQAQEPAVSPEVVEKLPKDDQLRGQIQKLLDDEINPAVASHGGYITLLDVQDGRVFIKMGGGCQGCGMADVTLRSGIERVLRERVPGIVEILDTSDHANGQNPYYRTAHS